MTSYQEWLEKQRKRAAAAHRWAGYWNGRLRSECLWSKADRQGPPAPMEF